MVNASDITLTVTRDQLPEGLDHFYRSAVDLWVAAAREQGLAVTKIGSMQIGSQIKPFPDGNHGNVAGFVQVGDLRYVVTISNPYYLERGRNADTNTIAAREASTDDNWHL